MNIFSKFQLPSSDGLGVKVSEDISTKDDLPVGTYSTNDKGVCRTGPATPGLFNIRFCSLIYVHNPVKGLKTYLFKSPSSLYPDL